MTGFVRDTPDELVETVARLDEIDRGACRRHVAERFSSDAMTAGYERLAHAELERATRRPLAVRLGGRRCSVSDPPEPVILAGGASTVTLIDGLTFAISDALGDICGDADGLIADDTRHLSRLAVRVDGAPPRSLGRPSSARRRRASAASSPPGRATRTPRWRSSGGGPSRRTGWRTS